MIGLNSRIFIFHVFIIRSALLDIIIIFKFGCYLLYRANLTPIAYTMSIIAIRIRRKNKKPGTTRRQTASPLTAPTLTRPTTAAQK